MCSQQNVKLMQIVSFFVVVVSIAELKSKSEILKSMKRFIIVNFVLLVYFLAFWKVL